MKFTLINPPQGTATGNKPNIKQDVYHFPAGILYIASIAESTGNEVNILDFPLLDWNLKNYEKWLKKENPDVIGISFCTPSISFVKAIAKTTRFLSPNTQIVLGGPHVTFSPEQALKEDWADYIVRYEGELVIKSLLKEISKLNHKPKTKGVSFIKNNKVIHNKAMPFISNLDILGIPAYHLINIEEYINRLNRISINSMRGCPFNCTFCTIPKLMGLKARTRSPKMVLNEMKMLISNYGVNNFIFSDPNFALFPQRLEEIAKGIQDEGLEVSIGCQSRVSTLNEKNLDILKKMGCRSVFIGIESGTFRIQSYYNKVHKKNLLKNLELILRKGIEIVPSFIIGSPEERKEDMLATINLAKKIISMLSHNQFQINMYGPFPGLPDNLHNEISLEFAPVIPISGTKYVDREHIKDIWHRVWKEFFPEYYKDYLKLEEAAEQGVNLLFEQFLKHSYLVRG